MIIFQLKCFIGNPKNSVVKKRRLSFQRSIPFFREQRCIHLTITTNSQANQGNNVINAWKNSFNFYSFRKKIFFEDRESFNLRRASDIGPIRLHGLYPFILLDSLSYHQKVYLPSILLHSLGYHQKRYVHFSDSTHLLLLMV